jgi:hypothetical protein
MEVELRDQGRAEFEVAAEVIGFCLLNCRLKMEIPGMELSSWVFKKLNTMVVLQVRMWYEGCGHGGLSIWDWLGSTGMGYVMLLETLKWSRHQECILGCSVDCDCV